jgi:hypothetical protein
MVRRRRSLEDNMRATNATLPTPGTPAVTAAPATQPAARGRHDLYAGIHKALRLFMTRTLTTVGAADPADAAEVGAALDLLGRLLALCEVHLKDENDFIHPALERACPGASAAIAAEHLHHAEAIADLRELAAVVARAREAQRGEALARLYRALALFVAENFQHMHVEETAHNATLWAAYRDDELVAIHQALVASIPPAAVMEAMHWFLPALSHPERSGMLGEMRQGMPAPAFDAVLGIAARTLPASAHARLRQSLGLPQAEALAPA